MYCGDTSLVNTNGWEGTATPLRCKCWTCPDCAPGRKARLKALARRGHPTTFITLTASPAAGETPHEAAQTLVKAWRRIRRELVEKKGMKNPPFIAVFEKTKKGRPHLHILARVAFVNQKWLSNRMRHLARSPIVDIRRVHNDRQAASYVSKYLAKDPTRFSGCKRYWRSMDWDLNIVLTDEPPFERAFGWHHDPRSVTELCDNLSFMGYVTNIEGNTLAFCWPWQTAPPNNNPYLNGVH